MDHPRLEELLDEAAAQPFSGWDFSWLGDRLITEGPGWDFEAIVERSARSSPDLLDMGTGGGEWLARLPHRPPRTVATEGWPPNVPLARRRLAPVGIEVFDAGGGPDNVDQPFKTTVPDRGTPGALPFDDASFHLITNRHESWVAAEIRRVLAPGGHFVTQQVGGGFTNDFRVALGLADTSAPRPCWDLALATRQLDAAGLGILDSGEGVERHTFADAAALAWYLLAVPWTVEGFTIPAYRTQLHRLQERIDRGQPLVMRMPMFWLVATAT